MQSSFLQEWGDDFSVPSPDGSILLRCTAAPRAEQNLSHGFSMCGESPKQNHTVLLISCLPGTRDSCSSNVLSSRSMLRLQSLTDGCKGAMCIMRQIEGECCIHPVRWEESSGTGLRLRLAGEGSSPGKTAGVGMQGLTLPLCPQILGAQLQLGILSTQIQNSC